MGLFFINFLIIIIELDVGFYKQIARTNVDLLYCKMSKNCRY